jgi:glycosyltransferase involved in cell wall biosynthesis
MQMEHTPIVSVIIPCYNEEKTIGMLLDSLTHQTYPLDQMEVVIADGMSEDDTRAEIERFSANDSGLQVRVVDNHKRSIPAGLNTAIQNSRGEYIVRLDAHSVPHPEYITRSIKNLKHDLGDNVGGVWQITPSRETWAARSIATAASHPLGVGDAKYRYADEPGEADTVPFGAFRRSLFEELGGYDESLHTNEDYEFNTRIRLRGGKLWLDPSIKVKYFARPTFAQLAKQYWRYGYWKYQMVQRYPGSLRWRQALPPLFVFGLLVLAISSFWIPAAGIVLAAAVVSYSLALVLSGLDVVFQKGNLSLLLGVPLAIAVMHISWGSAFLWSFTKRLFGRKSAA